jgi:hypothetical protein
MPETPPRTALAEAALRSLAVRAGDHRRLTSGSSVVHGGRHQPAHRDTRNGNVVTDCVAVAESFSTARLLALRPVLDPGDVSTWKKQRQAWRNHGPVDLCLWEDWPKLMGYVEVRNALQHGLGRLTDLQLRKYQREISAWIKAANVQLNGPNVMLTDEDPIACSGVCADFVHFLDAAAPLA